MSQFAILNDNTFVLIHPDIANAPFLNHAKQTSCRAPQPHTLTQSLTHYWLCVYGGGDDVGMANEKKFFKSMR